MNIRAKLTGYFTLIAIFSISITGFLAFQRAETALRQKTIEHLETTIILKKNEIDIRMEENIDSFRILQEITQKELNSINAPTHSELAHKLIDERLNEFLEERQSQYTEFQEIFLMDAKTGAVHITTDSSQLSKIKSAYPYFTEGKNGLYIQNFYYSPSLNQTITTISAPLREKNGELSYVLAVSLNMEQLKVIMEESGGLGVSSETFLINRFNQPITPLKNIRSNASGIYSEDAKTCLSKSNGSGLYRDYRDVSVVSVYRWLPNYEICMIAKIDQSEAFRNIQLLRNIILITSALIIWGTILAGMLVSLNISKSINKLTEVTKSFFKGQFHKRVDQTTLEKGDEIGILARNIDKMQSELNRAFAEIQVIIETMPSALFVVTNEGRIELANQAAQKLLKYKKSELKETDFGQYFKDTNIIKKIFRNTKGKLKEHNTQMLTKTGEAIDVYISATKSTQRKNYSGGFIVVVKDISDLKRYAKKRIDEITPILNQISLGDFGASLDLPKHDDEFTELIVAISLMSDNLRELIAENHNKTDELSAANNKLKKSHKTLLKAKDNIEKEKAKAETLLRNIGEGILAITKNGEIIMINEAAEELFGTEASEVLGKVFTECCEFFDEKDRKISFEKGPIHKAAKTLKSISITTYHKKITGKSIALATTISPIIHGKEANSLVLTFRDISKEKEVDQAKTEFVSLASHQLRTPLTAIKWIIEELLRDRKINAKQKEYLSDALKSNKRMISLVNDLLNVSRLETGNISVTSVKTDVSELIKQVIVEAKSLSLEKQQKIELKGGKKAFYINVDPQLLRQIASNLISNSVKYSNPKTTITVEIQKKKTKAVLKVSDQGIGIPKKQQARIFQKFFRTGEAVKRSTTGSGLGLYIIKKVIDAMRGDISFKSVENKGTTFTVSLPLKGPVKSGDIKKLIEHRIS